MIKFTAHKNRGMTHSMFSPRHPEYSRGMTYVELVVVLGIMAVLSSVVMFNHGKFQAKIDVKTLANDIALKVVEAQKSSINGDWKAGFCSNCKPSYGLYFHTNASTRLVYFADLDNNEVCASPNCVPPVYSVGGEVLDVVSITRGQTISSLEVFGTGGCPATVTNLTIVFKRPNSSPVIDSTPNLNCNVSYVAINISSPQGANSKIKMYASGRVQIN